MYKGVNYSDGNKEQVSYSNVLEDWDLLGLKTGEAVISISEYDAAPMKFKFAE